MAIQRILVPTDFSPHSDRALELAFELARALGASVQVIHCFEELSGGRAPLGSAGLDPKLRANALERLKERVTGLQPEGVEVEFDVHPGIYPATAVVEAALKATPDLIVLGTHGRSGLTHALLGSVAEKVIREATCPVVTVKSA